MTDDRHTEKSEHKERSQGNLGQKQAKREETADEKLEHMDEKKSSSDEQAKKKSRDK